MPLLSTRNLTRESANAYPIVETNLIFQPSMFWLIFLKSFVSSTIYPKKKLSG